MTTPNIEYAQGYTQGVDDARSGWWTTIPTEERNGPFYVGYDDGYDDYQSGQAG